MTAKKDLELEASKTPEDPGDEPVNHIDDMFEDLPYIPEPERRW